MDFGLVTTVNEGSTRFLVKVGGESKIKKREEETPPFSQYQYERGLTQAATFRQAAPAKPAIVSGLIVASRRGRSHC